VLLFITGLLPRALGSRVPLPFDDMYHLKRIAWSAAHFPRVLAFDPDRGFHGAWCPWPPLYDATLGGVARLFGMNTVLWLPAIGTALFAAVLAWLTARRFGLAAGGVAGVLVAAHPYLIPVSSVGAVDHHWAEPLLAMMILGLTVDGGRWTRRLVGDDRRLAPDAHRALSSCLLGLAITAALFVQTALLVTAGLAFLALFFVLDEPRRGAISFAIPAIAVAIYRLAQPASYPSNPWFLGWPHAAVLAAAAVACGARCFGAKRLVALAVGTLCILPVLPPVLAGTRFFGGDPWLESITEFQPMFHDAGGIGTDLANLTGGAFLVFAIARRHRVVALFTIAYLLLSLTSHRFLVPAVPLFALAAAIAISEAKTCRLAFAAIAIALLPTLAYDAYALSEEPAPEDSTRAIAAAVLRLPPGRVLAVWSAGHAIDVAGRHPVVLDNFGSMPDPAVFEQGSRALLATTEGGLVRWCRAHGIRYVVFAETPRIASTAASIGMQIDPRTTVWWRMMRGRTAPFRIVAVPE
jgi:hypothetical protein